MASKISEGAVAVGVAVAAVELCLEDRERRDLADVEEAPPDCVTAGAIGTVQLVDQEPLHSVPDPIVVRFHDTRLVLVPELKQVFSRNRLANAYAGRLGRVVQHSGRSTATTSKILTRL